MIEILAIRARTPRTRAASVFLTVQLDRAAPDPTKLIHTNTNTSSSRLRSTSHHPVKTASSTTRRKCESMSIDHTVLFHLDRTLQIVHNHKSRHHNDTSCAMKMSGSHLNGNTKQQRTACRHLLDCDLSGHTHLVQIERLGPFRIGCTKINTKRVSIFGTCTSW